MSRIKLMKKLSKTNFQKVVNYIKRNGRELDQRLFSSYFENGTKEDVLKELKKYQNNDGGFGHGIEPDFRSPSSSPIATTMAIEYLEKIRVLKDDWEKAKGSSVNKLIYHLRTRPFPPALPSAKPMAGRCTVFPIK